MPESAERPRREAQGSSDASEAAGGGDRRPEPGRREAILLAGIALATLLGGWLRFAHLLEQTPFHDEWHALLAAIREPLGALALTFGSSDRSIPIALYLGLCRRLGLLDELTLWGPMAAIGTATIAGLALLFRRRLGTRAVLLFAIFVAFAPMLVYFSRTARPYALTAPLALLSVWSLASWRERATGAWAAAFVTSALIVGWALPVHFAFVAGACLWATLPGGAEAQPRPRSARAVVRLMAIVGAGLVLLIGPALVADWSSLAGKAARGRVVAGTFLRAATLLLGDGSSVVSAAVAALALCGAFAWWREPGGARRLSGLLAGATALLAVLVVVRPTSLERPFVLARYLLPVGIVALLLAAVGIARICERWVAPGASADLAAVAVVLVLVWRWPAWPGSGPENFVSWRLFQRIVLPGAMSEQMVDELPEAYRDLGGARPGSLSILEVPYAPLMSVPYPYYQARHRQRVYLGVSRAECGLPGAAVLPFGADAGFQFDCFVDLDSHRAESTPQFDRVVLHRDLAAELPLVKTPGWEGFDVARCERRLRSIFGAPAGEDSRTVWFEPRRNGNGSTAGPP